VGFAGSRFFFWRWLCCISPFKPGFSIAQRFFPGGYDFLLVVFCFVFLLFQFFSVFFVFLGGIGKLID
jgi:hypothetical protein